MSRIPTYDAFPVNAGGFAIGWLWRRKERFGWTLSPWSLATKYHPDTTSSEDTWPTSGGACAALWAYANAAHAGRESGQKVRPNPIGRSA